MKKFSPITLPLLTFVLLFGTGCNVKNDSTYANNEPLIFSGVITEKEELMDFLRFVIVADVENRESWQYETEEIWISARQDVTNVFAKPTDGPPEEKTLESVETGQKVEVWIDNVATPLIFGKGMAKRITILEE